MLALFFLILGGILMLFAVSMPFLIVSSVLCFAIALVVSPDNWFHKKLYWEYKTQKAIQQAEMKSEAQKERSRLYRIKRAEERKNILKEQQAKLANLSTDWLEDETNRITKKMYHELEVMIDTLAESGDEIQRIVFVIKEIAKEIPLVFQSKTIDFSEDTNSDIDYRISNIQHMDQHFVNLAQLIIDDMSNVHIMNTLTFIYNYNLKDDVETGFYFTVHDLYEQVISLYCDKLEDITKEFISDLLKILVTKHSLYTVNFKDELTLADSMKMAIHARKKESPEAEPRREHISKAVRHEVWQRDKGRCVECGSKEKLEFDHIIPVSKGGANTVRNIQLLCEGCNRTKSANI